MITSREEFLALNNVGEAARQAGDNKMALACFCSALHFISQKRQAPSDEAAFLNNFGLLLQSMGQNTESVNFHRQALQLDLEGGSSNRELGFSYHNLGTVLSESGNAKEGLQYLIKAKDLRQAINDDNELIVTFGQLAKTCLDLSRINEAKRFAEEGLALTAIHGRSPQFRIILSALADIAKRQHDIQSAVQLHLEILQMLEALRRQTSNVKRLDLFDARYNKLYIDAIELFLEAGYFKEALAAIDRTRFRSGCDLLERDRGFGSPANHDSVLVPELRDDELILVEWIYPQFDWSFPLAPKHCDFNATKITTSTGNGIPRKVDLTTKWPTHFEICLNQTQKVIDAYEKDLAGVSRIVFVPHGVQWQTPFAALKHPRSKKALQETHDLLIVPSLRFCRITDKRPRIVSKRRVVIGDPTGDLPGARREAQNVANILDAELWIGAQVTRQKVLRELTGADIDILHYAGHGVYTEDGLSALQLADGLLTADEIQKCGCKANITNLASCWNGMTTFSVWNELHGFVRALLSTGTRNVICSVYPLGDAVASIFAPAFYAHYISEPEKPCAAFRQALISIPADADPAAWGGLYITGQR